MEFTSGEFLLFFPIVTLLYFLIPHKLRIVWLLAASYYFYMGWNAGYALLILISTIITYASGIVLEHIKKLDTAQERKIFLKKACLTVSLVSNLAILGYFKYANFFSGSLVKLGRIVGLQIPAFHTDVLLPVGISFYTFQALSYSIDVYRDEIYGEKNFFKYALFVSFFPQLVAGPIERSRNLLVQISKKHVFSYEKARQGLLMMFWGYFLKIVIADRAAIFVDTVYGNRSTYDGVYLLIATMLFAVQIYCDFNGYTMIARGAAKVMGFDLMENFDAPYLATSVAEFWRRWHISLTSWFKDYLYIPLGGSRKGKARKYLNKLIVFTVSGLWHGASTTFVVWGVINGLYQIIGEMLLPIRKKLAGIFDWRPDAVGSRIISCFITFVLIDFSWIFFRAKSTPEAFAIISSIWTRHNTWILFDGSLFKCGLDQANFILLLVCIAILFVRDLLKVKRVSLYAVYERQNWLVRSLLFVSTLLAVLLFGLYGPKYDASKFIYFQF